MNTNCSITPWHQSHLRTIRIQDLPEINHPYDKLKQGFTTINRKKSDSIQIIDSPHKRKKIRDYERMKTIDSPQKHELQRRKQKNQQKDELIKKIIVLRDNKAWFKKKASLQTLLSQSEIFKPKYELSSEKSYLKLPKIQIKVMK